MGSTGLGYDKDGSISSVGRRLEEDKDGNREYVEPFSSARRYLRRIMAKCFDTTDGRSLHYTPDFCARFCSECLGTDCTLQDGAATLAALTAALVVQSLRARVRELGRRCVALFVAGGGARNPTIIRHLEDEMGYHVHQLDTLGVPADAREAACFAALGWLYMQAMPANVPSVTGACEAARLGALSLP
mmetsp:Transcript_5440/g.19880  ORF Transcript_5440/g.19880 Transcript_5440/m.19880 type:complete len:188 (-) Transcript_5440:1457-2020(-)